MWHSNLAEGCSIHLDDVVQITVINDRILSDFKPNMINQLYFILKLVILTKKQRYLEYSLSLWHIFDQNNENECYALVRYHAGLCVWVLF